MFLVVPGAFVHDLLPIRSLYCSRKYISSYIGFSRAESSLPPSAALERGFCILINVDRGEQSLILFARRISHWFLQFYLIYLHCSPDIYATKATSLNFKIPLEARCSGGLSSLHIYHHSIDICSHCVDFFKSQSLLCNKLYLKYSLSAFLTVQPRKLGRNRNQVFMATSDLLL